MLENNWSFRHAIKMNKKAVRETQMRHQSFMNQIQRNPDPCLIGIYQDGDYGYNFED